jgi:hypothetical protein
MFAAGLWNTLNEQFAHQLLDGFVDQALWVGVNVFGMHLA